MTPVRKALLLASAMILVALGSVFEILPEQAAQFAPLWLMVFVPWVLTAKTNPCGRAAA